MVTVGMFEGMSEGEVRQLCPFLEEGDEILYIDGALWQPLVPPGTGEHNALILYRKRRDPQTIYRRTAYFCNCTLCSGKPTGGPSGPHRFRSAWESPAEFSLYTLCRLEFDFVFNWPKIRYSLLGITSQTPRDIAEARRDFLESFLDIPTY